MRGRPEKYAALRKFLKEKAKEFRNSGEIDHPMAFEEVEALGVALPPSAYKHRAWWSNNKYNNNNPFAKPAEKPWERAGFCTKDVDMTGHHITFVLQGPFSSEERARQEEKGKAGAAALRQMLSDIRLRKGVESSPDPATAGMVDGARVYSGSEKIAAGTLPRCRHPAYGALKGYIRLVAGTDLTEPADPEWGNRVSGDDTK